MNTGSNAMTAAPGLQVTAPPGAEVNAMTGRNRGAEALRQSIAGLNPAQRAWAGRQAEILSAIGQGLAGRPYPERRAILAHMTPQLAARGVAPAAIAGFDPTDANLAVAMGQAGALSHMLSAQPDGGSDS